MHAQANHPNGPTQATIRSLAWYVAWRVTARITLLVATSGAFLGLIYGMLVIVILSLLPNNVEPLTGLGPVRLEMSAFAGYMGFGIGANAGAALGLIEGLPLGGITYFLLRGGKSPACCARQYMIVALATAIAVDLLILLPLGLVQGGYSRWLVSTPANALRDGPPLIIAGLTVVTVTWIVARWVINQTQAVTPSQIA